MKLITLGISECLMVTFGIYVNIISHYLLVVRRCIPERHISMYPPSNTSNFLPGYKSKCPMWKCNWADYREVWGSCGNIYL